MKRIIALLFCIIFATQAQAYNVVKNNALYFPNPSKSGALGSGTMYVGNPDTDPTVVANRKTIYVKDETGTVTAVSQPLTLGAGGVPLYNGDPVTVLTDGDYSLMILNSLGAQVYYVPSDLSGPGEVLNVKTIADLRGHTPLSGQVAQVQGYYTFGDNNGGPLRTGVTGAAPGTYVDNGGSIIVPTGGDGSEAWVWDYKGPVNVKWYGVKSDGVTDAYATLVAMEVLHRNIYFPAGAYRLETLWTTSAAEAYSVTIEGDGPVATTIFTYGNSGIKLQSAGSVVKNLSVVDAKSYAVLPTAHPTAAVPVSGSITASTVGISAAGNFEKFENVFVYGFDIGAEHADNSKYYSTFDRIRSMFNNIDFRGSDNFSRSYNCWYSNAFQKNVDITAGSHTFYSCNTETNTLFDGDLANYPNGGVFVAATAGEVTFNDHYTEDVNWYILGSKFKYLNPHQTTVMVGAAPFYAETHFGQQSANLVMPPHKSYWTRGSGVTSVQTEKSRLDGRRYTTVTVGGAGGTSKTFASPFDGRIRGWNPEHDANNSYQTYVSCWIKFTSAGWDDANFYMIPQAQEYDGGLFFTETAGRTNLPIDTTNTSTWQHVSFLAPVRYTFTSNPAENLQSIRLYMNLGDTAADWSASPREILISEPEIRVYTSGGGELMEPNDASEWRMNIADDAAISFFPYQEQGLMSLVVDGAPTNSGLFYYRVAAAGANVTLYSATSNLNATTGVLAGTTGTDAKVTVSAHTNGAIYVENRSGGLKAFLLKEVTGMLPN